MLGDLGKLIVAKGFKKLPEVQKTDYEEICCWSHQLMPQQELTCLS